MTLDVRHANLGTTSALLARKLTVTDAEPLAELMLDAYRGTVDDTGETFEDARREVDKLYRGDYGILDFEASSLIDRGSTIGSATIVTRDKTQHATGEAFLAFSMTARVCKRQGLARTGLEHAIHVLRDRGEPRLHLVVTRANSPAVHIYRTVGFEVVRSQGS